MKYKHKVWDLVVEIDPSDQIITRFYSEPDRAVNLWHNAVRNWWVIKLNNREPLDDEDFEYFIEVRE